jgi:hypothetical protein
MKEKELEDEIQNLRNQICDLKLKQD